MRIHAVEDQEFKGALDEARQEIADQAEGYVTQYMARPGNFMDRIAWLRAYRSKVWNPAAQLNVTHDVTITANLASEARQLNYNAPKTIETTLEDKAK